MKTNLLDDENSRDSGILEDYLISDQKYDFENTPIARNLDELVSIIRDVFSREIVDIDFVKKILENYKSNPQDWNEYVKYNPQGYFKLIKLFYIVIMFLSLILFFILFIKTKLDIQEI
jgi:hypothetical protein